MYNLIYDVVGLKLRFGWQVYYYDKIVTKTWKEKENGNQRHRCMNFHHKKVQERNTHVASAN